MTQYSRRKALHLAATALGASLLPAAVQAASHAQKHVVEIRGHAFHPASLTIGKGDSVEFVNKDRAPHTATHVDGAFDTGRLGRNQNAKMQFKGAGRYSYFCAVHPSMKGEIIVA
ncbi:MAG: cupredoxin domain-containing protein [Primorskyibacter sp.]